MSPRAILAWLGPWRVEGTLAERLGVVFATSVLWEVLIVLGEASPAVPATWLGVAAAIMAYPVLTAWTIRPFLTSARGSGGGKWATRLLVCARPLLVVTLLGIALQVPTDLSPGTIVTQDVSPSVICAARDVLGGHDPYRTPELRCLHELHLSPLMATPLRAGPFANLAPYPTPAQELAVARETRDQGYRTSAFPYFGYPPLSFLSMLPVAHASRGMGALWTLLWAAGLLLALGRLAERYWPAVILIFALQWSPSGVLGMAAGGDAEFFAVALMALALVLMDSSRVSAVLLGLAVATSQLAWLIVPGYLVWSRWLPQPGRRLRWLCATAGIAMLPWLAVYPDAASAIVRLVTQPSYPFGLGVVALRFYAPSLPVIDKSVYLATTAAAEVVAVFLGGLSPTWAPVAVLLGPAALWLSWRSLPSYLGLMPVLACCVALGLDRVQRRAAPARSPGPDLRVTAQGSRPGEMAG